MKKVCLGVIMASIALGSFAQESRPGAKIKSPYLLDKKVNENSFQLKNNIWTETFDGIGTYPVATEGPTWTTSNGDWTVNGVNGNVWKHSFFGSTGPYSSGENPDFTSAADGFMIFDSDSANGLNSQNVLFGELISPQIDLTAQSSALLVFEQNFSFCCSNNPLDISVAVSSDNGVTWSGPINLSSGVNQNETYEGIVGSYEKSANITPLAAGNTIRLKFTWNGVANNSIYYYWAIDDICITQAPDNELVGFGEYFGSQDWTYYQIPTSQVQPIDFSAKAENLGNLTQNDVQLNVSIDNGAFTTTSPAGVSYSSTFSGSLSAIDQYTPPATVGSHTLNWNVSQSETDENPSNNTLTQETFEITEFTYARDNGTAERVQYNFGYGFETGIMYDIVTDQTIYSIDASIDSFTADNVLAFVKVYEISGANYNQVAQSDYFAIPNSNFDQWVTIPLLSPYSLEAEKTYLITIGSDGNGGVGDDLVVNLGQRTEPNGTAWFDTPASHWSFTGYAAMVRMNFDPSSVNVGVEENTLEGVAIFPNPTTGVITISNDNQTENKIEVRDLAGKVITSTSAAIETTIDLTGNASGVYMVKVYNENGATIEKVTLK